MPSALAVVRKFHPQVRSIKDATGPITVEVTPNDVKESKVKSHRACALAVACQRKLKLDGIVVSRAMAYLVKGTRAVRYKLPESAIREVIAFDRGGSFDIGNYTLQEPPEYLRLGAKKAHPHSYRGKLDGSRRMRHITGNIRATLGGPKK